MQAGKLRHRVTFQEEIVLRDTDGAELKDWSNMATVWGAVEPLTGQERYVSDGAQFLATANTRIRIRYREGIHHKLRVAWEGRVFNILHIADVETRNREIHLLCEERPEAE